MAAEGTKMQVALAGDTMLGRKVAERLERDEPSSLVDVAVAAVTRAADLFVLNLECALSARGERWPDPAKPFFFRGPPSAVGTLTHLGVGCVTLANNHALDYGPVALLDTLAILDEAGIAHVGAGADERRARAPVVLERAGVRVGVMGATDHPVAFAAGPGTPGVAYADLRSGVPDWLLGTVRDLAGAADVVLVLPHWGPNMVGEPVPHVRRAARALLDAGATLVAGHSAHVFHGVDGPVLYDLGDFLDDYATDPVLRNDRGLLWLVELDGRALVSIEAVPLALDYCRTRLAEGEEAAWIHRRLAAACAPFATRVEVGPGGERLRVHA